MAIAKNKILSRPKEVFLFNKNLITHFDLGSSLFYKEEQIQKIQRDKGSINNLSQLYPYVDINILEEDLLKSIEKYNIVIISEIIKNDLLYSINELCSKKKIGLIYGAALGGDEHIIINRDGKALKMFYITNISNEKRFGNN